MHSLLLDLHLPIKGYYCIQRQRCRQNPNHSIEICPLHKPDPYLYFFLTASVEIFNLDSWNYFSFVHAWRSFCVHRMHLTSAWLWERPVHMRMKERCGNCSTMSSSAVLFSPLPKEDPKQDICQVMHSISGGIVTCRIHFFFYVTAYQWEIVISQDLF